MSKCPAVIDTCIPNHSCVLPEGHHDFAAHPSKHVGGLSCCRVCGSVDRFGHRGSAHQPPANEWCIP